MALSKNFSRTLPLLLGLAPLAAPVQSQEVSDLTSMFSEGKAYLDFRYRFEYVDEDGFDKEAEASTLRSRLGFDSAVWNGVSVKLEFDDVTDIGDDDFNSTSNGNTEFPVVADPEGTEINQAYLKYVYNDASGVGGRQRILHGNQRFIGGVAWRQNEQTYDGFRAMWDGGDTGIKLDYAYAWNVNRIFGPDDGPVQPGDLEGDNHFFRADWKFLENHSVAGFVYLLDIDENENYPAGRSVGNSTDTYGIEYAGKIGPVGLKASYATQENAGDSPLDYEADYYFVEAAVQLGPVKPVVGYEVLASDNNVGFKTPYATLHKFQGWADKFLVTPGDGIEDAYVGITGALGPVKLGAFYHDFQAESSSTDFGTEIDLVATWPVKKWLTLQAKLASFDTDASDRYSDTDKFWLTAQVKF